MTLSTAFHCLFYLLVTSYRALSPQHVEVNMDQHNPISGTRTESQMSSSSDGQIKTWLMTRLKIYTYMGRNIPRQHFLALSVVFLGRFKQLQLLDYCIYVNKVKFPRIFGWTPWSGCFQTEKILPGNLCRK